VVGAVEVVLSVVGTEVVSAVEEVVAGTTVVDSAEVTAETDASGLAVALF